MEEPMKRLVRIRRQTAGLFVAVFTLAAAASLLSACNTVAGMGQDVSAAGHGVTRGAEKVQSGM
jgi:predicted small secreted protein